MNNFLETGLYPEILDAVEDLGFKQPTPIQQQTIPFLLSNENDLIALAQTGTGKTAAFGLPLVHLTDPHSKNVQSLILCPTRELCLQIASDLAAYAKHLPKVGIVPIYGGANIKQQIKYLRQNPQIVVGTPGRTLDLIRQRELRIDQIEVLVLDEADEMLDRGFKHDLDAILSTAPKNKRTWLFSATMPDEIARISKQYLYEPHKIEVGQRNSGAKNVEHEYYIYPKKGRYAFLKKIIKGYGEVYGIVFCRTKRKAREVARRLKRDGFRAVALEGDMSQPARDKAMAAFRTGRAQLLIATDVAARGVDIDDLSHVINFNIPEVDEVYIHRSGRTGRANRSGLSVAIIDEEELSRIRGLEKLARKSFTRMTLDDLLDGERPQVQQETRHTESKKPEEKQDDGGFNKALFDKLDQIVATRPQHPDFMQRMPAILDYLDGVGKEELIQGFVSYLANKGEFNNKASGQKQGQQRSGRRRGGRRHSRNRQR